MAEKKEKVEMMVTNKAAYINGTRIPGLEEWATAGFTIFGQHKIDLRIRADKIIYIENEDDWKEEEKELG